jgi:hypothetical protein
MKLSKFLLTSFSISPKCRIFNKLSKMSTTAEWKPNAKIEEHFAAAGGNKFSTINAPTAGPRVDKELPVGDAPIQLYSLATPNGVKIDQSFLNKINFVFKLQDRRLVFCWKNLVWIMMLTV